MKRKLQALGRSLMQPVAIMPIAALLLGIGYAIDPTGWGVDSPLASFLIKAGGAILDNLGLFFAVGVAFGLSKDKNGASALAGLVTFMTTTTLLSVGSVAALKGIPVDQLDATLGFTAIGNGNVFIGILSGILGAAAYNRFFKTQLPLALSFFSGRRLAPIVASLYGIVSAGVLFFAWPVVYSALVTFGRTVGDMGAVGAGIYGFFNRLLIPTGLHHALNNVFWFDAFGIGDIPNFWDPAKAAAAATQSYYAGMYQAGFFPIMMFGLPAAAFAIVHTAKPENKKRVASLMMAAALTSFVTGVTEPLEFSFMFLSPLLYGVHALLTGFSVFLAAQLKLAAGFGFSAGLIDYVLSSIHPSAHKPLFLLVIGLAFAVVYYAVFRLLITKLNLKTPGRENEPAADEGVVLDTKTTNFTQMAATILEGLGGKENVDTVDYCATRLRVDIHDYLLIDESKIKSSGVAGVVRPSQKNVQVIIGPQVQFVKDEMDKML